MSPRKYRIGITDYWVDTEVNNVVFAAPPPLKPKRQRPQYSRILKAVLRSQMPPRSKEDTASNTAVTQLASEDDAAVLGEYYVSMRLRLLTPATAKMGYKQELRRNFTMIEVFGIAFSIMGLLPSIASTLVYSIPAGPAGMVWGWFLASGLIFIVGLAMADLGSAMPTSGGLYWWTHFFSSPKTRNPLCFLVGYSNTLGLVGGLCSIDYGFALMFLSVIVVARDGNWSPSNDVIYLTFLACVFCHGVLASVMSKIMGKLQTVFVVMNFILIAATIIALPIGARHRRNDGSFIFTHVENLTTWPTGWAFMLSWLSPIWTIGAFDSCVHMSEEAANATKAVVCWPFGFQIQMLIILRAIRYTHVNWIMLVLRVHHRYRPGSDHQPGFKRCHRLRVWPAHGSGACPKISSQCVVRLTSQIYFDALGKHGTLGLMSLLFIVQFLMGLSILVAASRQAWAFSRDGALPFSSIFRPISKRFGYIPLRTVWGCVILAAVLGLLSLIAEAAAQALFSLAVAGNNLAWVIPILARVVWGQKKFKPGPIYTGDRLSVPIAWAAIVFLIFGIILCMFPVGGPSPTRKLLSSALYALQFLNNEPYS